MEIIFLLVGLVFMAAGTAIIVSELKARVGAPSVSGQIVGFSTGKNSIKASFRSVAEFVDPAGRKYYVEGSVGSSVPLHAVGAPVTVLVPDGNPENAVLQSRLSLILGSAFAVMGLVSTIAFWMTFEPSIFSLGIATVIVGGIARQIKRAWRDKPFSLEQWRQYKKQAFSPKVFQSKDEIAWADPISILAAIQNQQRANRFSIPILLVLGLGLAAGSYYGYKRTEAFLARADRSSGEVIELRESEASDDSSSTYAAVVAYSDRRGQQHKFVDSLSSNPPMYYRGQAVGVLYNRENPGDARIDRGAWNHWLSILLGSFAALFITLALLSARKRSRLTAFGFP